MSGRRGLCPAVWSHQSTQDPSQSQQCASGSSREWAALESPASSPENNLLTLFSVGLCKIPKDRSAQKELKSHLVFLWTPQNSETHIQSCIYLSQSRMRSMSWQPLPLGSAQPWPENKSSRTAKLQAGTISSPLKFYSPTTHSPCACEGGDQQDLQFSLFSLTSHLVLFLAWHH